MPQDTTNGVPVDETCLKYNLQCGAHHFIRVAQPLSRAEMLVYVVFSAHGNMKDIDEFVDLINDRCDSQQKCLQYQHIKLQIQKRFTELTLNMSDQNLFELSCGKYVKLTEQLLQCANNQGQEMSKTLIVALLESLRSICRSIGDDFEIMVHYVVYERLGTLSSILRSLVSKVGSEDWIIRAIGEYTPRINCRNS